MVSLLIRGVAREGIAAGIQMSSIHADNQSACFNHQIHIQHGRFAMYGWVLSVSQSSYPCRIPTYRRRGSVSGFAEVEELEWGKEGYEDTVQRMASTPVDWVLAADCCYIDNVRLRAEGQG